MAESFRSKGAWRIVGDQRDTKRFSDVLFRAKNAKENWDKDEGAAEKRAQVRYEGKVRAIADVRGEAGGFESGSKLPQSKRFARVGGAFTRRRASDVRLRAGAEVSSSPDPSPKAFGGKSEVQL